MVPPRTMGVALLLATLLVLCHTTNGQSYRNGMVAPALNSGPSMATINSTFYRWDSVKAPDNWDWSTSKAMTPVGWQLNCASCWTLSVADAISIFWAIVTNQPPVQSSPQQICDCSTKQCCQGGWPEWAFSYVTFNGGLGPLSSYNYRAMDSPVCLANSSSNSAIITGWEQTPANSPDAVKKAVSKHPVVAMLSATKDFQTYKGGIFVGNCSNDLNHAVLIVGYRKGDSKNPDYWIIKNSWGLNWGENGYMRMAILSGGGLCGITSTPALYPVFYPNAPPEARFAFKGPIKPGNNDPLNAVVYQSNWWAAVNLGARVSVDPCKGVINPCGAGDCKNVNGFARCKCPGGYVEHVEVPTSKCVMANQCSNRPINPCGNGTCVSTLDGSYLCMCNRGLVIGSSPDGSPTCSSGDLYGGYQTYSTLYGDTVDSIAASYNTTCRYLLKWNRFLSQYNCSDSLPPSVPIMVKNSTLGANCISTYIVQDGVTFQNIADQFGLKVSDLMQMNPGVNPGNLFTSQALCVSTGIITADQIPPRCTQTYVSQPFDTCQSINAAFGVTDITAYNPGLNCNIGTLAPGLYLCVSTNPTSAVNCTQWYTVQPGDDCPKIWNAANLTQDAFLVINPGIRCTHPYLQVGTEVCLSSPQAAPYTSNGLTFPYVVTQFDTLQSISDLFAVSCNRVPTPNSICVMNNFTICTDNALVTGNTIQIPCSAMGGNNCGCSDSLRVCGSDYNLYSSYCQAVCDYSSPVISTSNGCNTCQVQCNSRTGLTPKNYQLYSNAPYNCMTYWYQAADGTPVCKYPTWPPTDASWVVGPYTPDIINQCVFANSACQKICTASANSKATDLGTTSSSLLQGYFMDCYNACYAMNTGTGCMAYNYRNKCLNYNGICKCKDNILANCDNP